MFTLTRRFALMGLIAPALAACGGGHGAGSASGSPVPDEMGLGNPAAKVTVIEYASVACPVCGRWYKDVWPAFKAKYIDTGKIHYIFREMLVGDQNEQAIAASGFLLARCAGKDKYFSVVDAVFKSQPGLFEDPNTVLVGVAKDIGISEGQFDACVRNETALNALTVRVQSNAANGKVDATPTFVINGKAMDAGYQPLAAIDAAITAAQSA